MVPLAEILRRHWPAYRARFGNAIPPAHRAAVTAILTCRTPQRGGHVYGCDCGHLHYGYHSCGHRACNLCGRGEAKAWSQRQEARLLPVSYFLVTFTVPEPLREFFRTHPKELYGAFFHHSAGAMQDVALTKLELELGFVGVLHTWTRQLIYHPHIHYLVPGGGLTPTGHWKSLPDSQFFVHENVLAARCKSRLRRALKKDHPDLFQKIPAKVWQVRWVVDVQPAGRGTTALRYLAAYVQKTALSAARLLACDDQSVRFTYQDRKTQKVHTLCLSGEEFLRRFLQHVLPPGFQRVRHFGWLSPAAKARWQHIESLFRTKAVVSPAAPPPPGWAPECPRCHKPMRLLGTLPRSPP